MMNQFLLENLREMDMIRLTDLLADQTERFTWLLSNRIFNNEYEQIKLNLYNIQIAIQEKVNEEKFE